MNEIEATTFITGTVGLLILAAGVVSVLTPSKPPDTTPQTEQTTVAPKTEGSLTERLQEHEKKLQREKEEAELAKAKETAPAANRPERATQNDAQIHAIELGHDGYGGLQSKAKGDYAERYLG